jgi:hypothetical protein
MITTKLFASGFKPEMKAYAFNEQNICELNITNTEHI